MPDATITSTASTFGTISGTFSSDQSTVTGTISGVVTGTLTGSVGVPGPAGPGVPTGGTTGQVLAKVDGVDYNTEWVNASGGVWGTITGTLSNQTDLQTALNLKAPLASPALTGVPTAPTAATLTSTTQLATTAFVQQELAAGTAVAKNLEVYVRNQSGSTIPAGSIVYISGATGNRPLITLAQANNDANSAQTIGFVKASIANNGFGYVMVRGELENIDTSALTEGVQLYLSPTTAGSWTTTKPSAPEHLVYVGIVIRSHPTLGVILVAVQNGYELNELHDVAISSPTNGQVLKYDSATSLWKNATDSSGVAWGGITGTLSNQTDLQSALDGKYSTSNPSGYITSSALTGYATQAWVDAQGYLQAGALTGYALESWVTSQGYLTSGSLVGYATESYVTSALTGYATESWVIGLGYITSVDANAAFYPLTGNPSGFVDSSALSGYATESWVTSQGYLTSAPVLSVAGKTGSVTLDNTDISGLGTMATASTSDYSTTTVANGLYYPLSSNPSGYLVAADIAGKANSASPALTGNVTITTNSTSPALFIEQSGTGNILTLHDQASDTTFVAIDQNGKIATIASTTTNAGFNVPHGTAPTTPVNGDIWTTTSGLLARINGATRQYVDLDGTQTINGAKTFSGANQTLGNSTTAGTINIGTGAVATGGKTINIGTGSAAGSSVAITFGTAGLPGNTVFNGGGQFQVNNNIVNIGTNTATSSATFAGGATISGSTKTVSIGSGGVAGSTTNINLGTVDGGAATVTTNALLVTRASATTGSGLRVPHGAAPTSPTNGDIWTDTAGVYARINGTTRALVPPTVATTAEANNPASTTAYMSPNLVRQMLMFPGMQTFQGGGAVGTSGTGASAPSTTARWRQLIGPNAATAGYSTFVFDTNASSIGFIGSDRGNGEIGKDFARRFWFGSRTLIGATASNLNGDANNLYRCELGGRNVLGATGDPTMEGIGWSVTGGGASAITFYMRTRSAVNGGTYNSVATSFTPTSGIWFDWMIYYDGTGTAQMYVNDNLVGTISASFTGYQEVYNHYTEQIEQTVSAAARLAVDQLPTRVFFSE